MIPSPPQLCHKHHHTARSPARGRDRTGQDGFLALPCKARRGKNHRGGGFKPGVFERSGGASEQNPTWEMPRVAAGSVVRR